MIDWHLIVEKLIPGFSTKGECGRGIHLLAGNDDLGLYDYQTGCVMATGAATRYPKVIRILGVMLVVFLETISKHHKQPIAIQGTQTGAMDGKTQKELRTTANDLAGQ
ncbi:MAG: hypothetical protein IT447_16635 [Phycisphaerales bacterium]|nr:hypothetical protein [Phycisphaerales bacterium]